jgi:FAD synthetase
MPTAGLLVIGNEILSGKVEDTNSPYLAKELRELGVDLERILTIPDDIDGIALEVRAMSEAYDFVFTSGGIGPTHDDVTIDGIAKAFGREIEESASMMERMERAQGKPPNDSQRKMAQIPTDSVLIDSGDLWFPIIVVENVHIFPGIPELLRKKFQSIRERFRGIPFLLRRIYVTKAESDIAHSLNELLIEFPELMLGSYPRIAEEHYRVMLTLESRDAEYLERALASLLERIPGDAIHKIE